MNIEYQYRKNKKIETLIQTFFLEKAQLTMQTNWAFQYQVPRSLLELAFPPLQQWDGQNQQNFVFISQ